MITIQLFHYNYAGLHHSSEGVTFSDTVGGVNPSPQVGYTTSIVGSWTADSDTQIICLRQTGSNLWGPLVSNYTLWGGVPEPSSLLLAALGLTALIRHRR